MAEQAADIVRTRQLRSATLADLATALRTGNANIRILMRTTGPDAEIDRLLAKERRMTDWARQMDSQARVAAARLDRMTPTEETHQLTALSQSCIRRSVLSQMLKRKAWARFRNLRLAKDPTDQQLGSQLNDAPGSATKGHAAKEQSRVTSLHAAKSHSPVTDHHTAEE